MAHLTQGDYHTGKAFNLQQSQPIDTANRSTYAKAVIPLFAVDMGKGWLGVKGAHEIPSEARLAAVLRWPIAALFFLTVEMVDRRPIAARSHPLAQATATWLVRCGVSANAISIAGLIAGMAAGAAFAATRYAPGAAPILWIAGAVLVQLRLAANMFDGMVALARGASSPVGELYNEVPDRVSDSAVLIGLGLAADDFGLGVAAALAAMATAYVRALGKASAAGSDFSGPMAKQQRMFLVTALAVWTGLAPPSWQPEFRGMNLSAMLLVVITAGAVLTALRRLCRIAATLHRQSKP
jgi:phosphatidylglycerophosphate synthase